MRDVCSLCLILFRSFILYVFQQGRKLDLITIDQVEKPPKLDGKNFLRVIVVLARSHPGESAASFVCQGLLDFLLGSHPIAMILRKNFIFKIVPMVNPDGVFLGNNRCNLIGQDLNRCWNVATEFSHPTIVAVKNMLKDIDNSDVSGISYCGKLSKSIVYIILLSILLSLNRLDSPFTTAPHTMQIRKRSVLSNRFCH